MMPKPGQKPQPGQQGQKPKPDSGAKADNQGQKPGQPKPNRGSTAATTEPGRHRGQHCRHLPRHHGKSRRVGRPDPRERDAIIQGTSEKIIQKYKKLTDDYYEMMGKKGSESR